MVGKSGGKAMIVALILSVVFNIATAYLWWSERKRHNEEIRWIYFDWAIRFRHGEFSDLGIDPKVASDMKIRMQTLIAESLKKTVPQKPMNHTGVKP